jgi:hypothetical protein
MAVQVDGDSLDKGRHSFVLRAKFRQKESLHRAAYRSATSIKLSYWLGWLYAKRRPIGVLIHVIAILRRHLSCGPFTDLQRIGKRYACFAALPLAH